MGEKKVLPVFGEVPNSNEQLDILIHILRDIPYVVSTVCDPQFIVFIPSLIIRRIANVFDKVDDYAFKQATTDSLPIFRRKATGWTIRRSTAGRGMRCFPLLETAHTGCGTQPSS
jgi:hypothetical protein